MSATLDELVQNHVGYRDNKYGRLGAYSAVCVIRYECEVLANTDILAYMKITHAVEPRPEAVMEWVVRRCGVDAKALWLTTREGVFRHYGRHPHAFTIGADWWPISDLDIEGILFVYPATSAWPHPKRSSALHEASGAVL